MSGPALPSLDPSAGELVIAPPAEGDGNWAGAPSAFYDDGTYYLAYRLRRPVNDGRGYANVLARSDDGVAFTTIALFDKDELGTASLERPAVVRRPDGGWRIFLSLSTEGSKHWRIDALDADAPEDLPAGDRVVVWPGDDAVAVKDPVVLIDRDGRWHAWLCCHPLDVAGSEDRMTTRYTSSVDGQTWSDPVQVLAPGLSGWDRRGRRLTTVRHNADGSADAYYDGRRSAEENWYERTGHASAPGLAMPFVVSDPAIVGQSQHGRGTLRYASIVPVGGGRLAGWRVYYEAATPSGANEIRTQFLPA
ncbi:hypothetical protein M6D93_13045 [Jatrophihabitans telluris]|uniref:Exo-alpha-sialidase n=1 Tax=Jatrophihabitans telluris TaxID=2038343 RepID=A0ABY4QW52_9ACTN|nr:hypothetical protein [Jatrophihabitans telluris]UQX87225.1 hypothetical protein M6D93_13045 [Jatrophihabitans telluris]